MGDARVLSKLLLKGPLQPGDWVLCLYRMEAFRMLKENRWKNTFFHHFMVFRLKQE